jgi:hypothetical protein
MIERFNVVLDPDLVVKDSFGVLLDEFCPEQYRQLDISEFIGFDFEEDENLFRNEMFLPNLFVRNGPRVLPGYPNEDFIFRRDIYFKFYLSVLCENYWKS